MSILFLTADNCGFVKRALSKSSSEIKSTHLSEALAAALGFRTHAALLAKIKVNSVNQPIIVQIDDGRMKERLRKLGYSPTTIDLCSVARSTELPSPAWCEFGNQNRAANNDWFRECQRRNIPNIYIKLRTKYSKLSWDCITIDPSCEDYLFDENGTALAELMFKRFQSMAKGSQDKPEFFGTAFTGTIDGLSSTLAREIADEFFMQLYPPVRQQLKLRS